MSLLLGSLLPAHSWFHDTKYDKYINTYKKTPLQNHEESKYYFTALKNKQLFVVKTNLNKGVLGRKWRHTFTFWDFLRCVLLACAITLKLLALPVFNFVLLTPPAILSRLWWKKNTKNKFKEKSWVRRSTTIPPYEPFVFTREHAEATKI